MDTIICGMRNVLRNPSRLPWPVGRRLPWLKHTPFPTMI